MSRPAALALRTALSVAMVGVVVWWVGPGDLVGTLARVSLAGFCAVVLVHTGDRLLMALKWQRLLRARQHELGVGDAVRAYYVSSFAGVFLPMTVGADVVRVAALQGGPVGGGPLIASIGVERAVGAVSQGLFCALSVVLLVTLRLRADVPLPWLSVAVAAAILVAALALPLSFRTARHLGSRLSGAPGLRGKLGALAQEYAAWRDHPGAIRAFFLLTLLEGLFPILSYWTAARALGVAVGPVELAAVVPIVYLIARMPLGVAGIGPEQGSFAVAAALLLGMPVDDATAVSFLVSPLALLVALLPGAVAYLFVRRG